MATSGASSSSSSSSSSPSSSSPCEVSHYALGLFFILLVSLIWSAASVLVQYLYDGMSFNSPFLLTYIGTSLFVLLLPSRLIWERRSHVVGVCCCGCHDSVKNKNNCCSCYCCSGANTAAETSDDNSHEHDMIIPWRSSNYNNKNTSDARGYTSVNDSGAPFSITQDDSHHHHHHHHPNDPLHLGHHHHIHPDAARADGTVRLIPDRDHQQVIPHDMDTDHDNVPTHNSTNNHQHNHHHHKTRHVMLLSHEDHIRIALKIAPVWFVANWSYNASLAYTSISSSTVLASTSSLFTFLIAVICRDEDFSALKLLGVLLGVCGSILTGWHDFESHPNNNNSNHTNSTLLTDWNTYDNHTAVNTTTSTSLPFHHHHLYRRFLTNFLNDNNSDHNNLSSLLSSSHGALLLGDFLSLLSAVGYAVQVVLIRVLCPRDEQSMSMQLMLGYVGLCNAIMFSPVALYQLVWNNHNNNNNNSATAAATASTAGQLTWTILGFMVVKGLLDNVLSDYLWARAVVLTTATVATVGLGLTIPLAFASDWILGHLQVVSVSSILGALSILIGFVLVNMGYHHDDDDHDDGGDDPDNDEEEEEEEEESEEDHEIDDGHTDNNNVADTPSTATATTGTQTVNQTIIGRSGTFT